MASIPQPAILVVCLNPTFQRTMVLDHLWEGEVNRCSQYYLDASGKGINVARVISQLGGKAIHLTHLGGARTQELLGLLSEDSIEAVWADSHSPIRTCTTVINKERGSTTELVEEPLPVAPGTDKEIRRLFSETLERVATVVISGTRSGGYSPDLYPEFVRQARLAGKKVVLDIKGNDLLDSLPWGPDVIKPNLSEFAATFLRGHAVREQEDNHELKDACAVHMADIWFRYGVATALSRGSRNLWAYGEEGFFELEVTPVEALNTIGCGDAVTAGIAFSLTEGKTLREAVEKGLRCGAANALTIRPGTIL
jgi:1-phosphofructokinase family hexose kinase